MQADGATAAFFEPKAGALVPAPQARSPWSADMLHGRLLAGLAARAVEREAASKAGAVGEAGTAGVPASGFRLTRLTVDLFRAPPMEPVEVATSVSRDGRRVRALDVSIHSGGEEVARAHALMLHTGPHPDGEVWTAPGWSVPPPDALPRPEGAADMGGWEIRPISPGGFWGAGQKRLWTRDTWALVSGEALSPVVRMALAADLPNPLANSGTGGLRFINADLTLHSRRPATSDWIGLEVAAHLGQDGIAIGACTMYDFEGAIGWSSVCAVANQTGSLMSAEAN